MNKWLKCVDEKGFHGRIQVRFFCAEWEDPVFEVKITDKDGEELFNRHEHISNPAEASSAMMQSLIEDIMWELKNEK